MRMSLVTVLSEVKAYGSGSEDERYRPAVLSGCEEESNVCSSQTAIFG